ncbi:hypothetical protein OAK75_04050 [Bacteriovoracales bacterium]|nr:hypothetical protein [Bacteriovoracales bacterium]
MKKALLGLAFGTLSFSAFSVCNLPQAEETFGRRGENRAHALKAANMYGQYANTVSGVEKAECLTNKSEALYFYALSSNGKRKAKMALYWDAYEAGLQAVRILGDRAGDQKAAVNPKMRGNESALSKAMWVMGINIGKWGKLKGPFSALGKWNKILKPRIKDAYRLDKTVADYGIQRLAGKALLVLGGNINGNSGFDFLREGYQATKHANSMLTRNLATTTYFLEALAKRDDVDTFCDLYDELADVMDSGRNNDSILEETFFLNLPTGGKRGLAPDSRLEYKEFLGEKKVHKHYNREC